MSAPHLSRPTPNSKIDWIALPGILVTVVVHLILQWNSPNTWFIVVACVFWGAYVAWNGLRDRSQFHRWGFRSDNLREAAVMPLLLLVVATVAMGIYALGRGQLALPIHAYLLFVLYPIWGLFQQFLVMGIAVQNMELFPSLARRPWLIVLIGATLFGAVHAPQLPVLVATFAIELLLIPHFMRFRNLWPLGIVHGWLGVFFYYWVLGRDVLAAGL
jgi:hypothetical protein